MDLIPFLNPFQKKKKYIKSKQIPPKLQDNFLVKGENSFPEV